MNNMNNNTTSLENEFDQTNLNMSFSSNSNGVIVSTMSQSHGISFGNMITTINSDDIFLRGKSLVEFIEKVEERLSILHPNSELESRWDELRELRARYQRLEQEILWDELRELRARYQRLEREILEKEKIMRVLNR